MLPKSLLSDSMRGWEERVMAIEEVALGLGESHGLSKLVRYLHVQTVGGTDEGQELVPSPLGENQSERSLPENPSLTQNAVIRLVLYLVADRLDERTDALFEDDLVRLADEA